MIFLRYADVPEYRKIVNEVIMSKEALQMAASLLMSVSQDERERAVLRSRRMYQSDLDSNLATAEYIGEQRGKLIVAGNAKSMGIDVDVITKLTGLTREEVENLNV